VDRLHPISGIKAKLEGYQHFLKTYPPFRQNTCLIQYVLPPENDTLQPDKQDSMQTEDYEVSVYKGNSNFKIAERSHQTNWTHHLNQHTL